MNFRSLVSCISIIDKVSKLNTKIYSKRIRKILRIKIYRWKMKRLIRSRARDYRIASIINFNTCLTKKIHFWQEITALTEKAEIKIIQMSYFFD